MNYSHISAETLIMDVTRAHADASHVSQGPARSEILNESLREYMGKVVALESMHDLYPRPLSPQGLRKILSKNDNTVSAIRLGPEVWADGIMHGEAPLNGSIKVSYSFGDDFERPVNKPWDYTGRPVHSLLKGKLLATTLVNRDLLFMLEPAPRSGNWMTSFAIAKVFGPREDNYTGLHVDILDVK